MAGPPKRVKPMGAPLPRLMQQVFAQPPHVCEYCGRYRHCEGNCDGCGAPVMARRIPPKPQPPPIVRVGGPVDDGVNADLQFWGVGLLILVLPLLALWILVALVGL